MTEHFADVASQLRGQCALPPDSGTSETYLKIARAQSGVTPSSEWGWTRLVACERKDILCSARITYVMDHEKWHTSEVLKAEIIVFYHA